MGYGLKRKQRIVSFVTIFSIKKPSCVSGRLYLVENMPCSDLSAPACTHNKTDRNGVGTLRWTVYQTGPEQVVKASQGHIPQPFLISLSRHKARTLKELASNRSSLRRMKRLLVLYHQRKKACKSRPSLRFVPIS